jgi:hypothetical protein
LNKLHELLLLIETQRQNGKTTAIAKMVDDVKGVLLVHTATEAVRLQELYPNATIQSFYNLERLRGLSQPIFIDHHLLLKLH